MNYKTNLKVLFLFLMSLAVISCSEQAPRKTMQKDYPTIIVGKGSTQFLQKYSSRLRAQEYVDIKPQISGTITKINVQEGSTVKKGEVLFVIDQVPYKAALDVAKANVKTAEAALATAKLNASGAEALLKAKVISQTEYQTTLNILSTAEATLMLNKAQEKIAANNLSYTSVSSPVSGKAGLIPYKVGALVSSSITEPLVSISNNSVMQAYFSMSEKAMLDLARKTEGDILGGFSDVELILSDNLPYDQKGKIDAISANVDSSTGAVSLRASFENPKGLLLDGSNGYVSVNSSFDDVIVIPKLATFELQNKILVYTVVDNKAKSAVIEVYPIDNGKEYMVLSGIEVGTEIIAQGAGLIREGQQVKASK